MDKTRFEQIKEMDMKKMTEFLCHLTQAIVELTDVPGSGCDYCPASKYCKLSHNGFEDWLLETYRISWE